MVPSFNNWAQLHHTPSELWVNRYLSWCQNVNMNIATVLLRNTLPLDTTGRWPGNVRKLTWRTSYLYVICLCPRSISWSYWMLCNGCHFSPYSGFGNCQTLTRHSHQPSGVCQMECLVRLYYLQGKNSVSAFIRTGEKLWIFLENSVYPFQSYTLPTESQIEFNGTYSEVSGFKTAA